MAVSTKTLKVRLLAGDLLTGELRAIVFFDGAVSAIGVDESGPFACRLSVPDFSL